MQIRNATYLDAPAIKLLLGALGYTVRTSLLVDQLETTFNRDEHHVFVYELRKEVVGFVSVQYLPQLAFQGELMLINYFAIDEDVKHTGIAKELEQFITNQARIKKCERIQVHSPDWLKPAHQFYEEQGYVEHSKYFIKKLDRADAS